MRHDSSSLIAGVISTLGAADLFNYWHAIRSYLLLIAYCLRHRPNGEHFNREKLGRCLNFKLDEN